MKEGRKEEVSFIIVLNGVLGAVYTCDSAYESPYDSVYDFLHKVV
jgi:hypothetical protein